MLRTCPLLTLFLMTALLPAFSAPLSAPPTPPVATPPEAPPVIDLLPLKKALAPLEGSDALQSHSTIRMTGTRQGVSVVLREDLRILSCRPGRFRASLTQYDMTGGPQKKLVVVSNGATVWTYRPGLRQYSQMSLAGFKKADSEIPTLGLVVGGFYLGDGHPLVDGFHSITPGNSTAVLSALGSMDVTMARQTKSIGGQDDYVYSLTLAKQNLAYQFYVSSQTNRLTRVDLTGSQDSTQFTYREDILSIVPQSSGPSSVFVFTPPLGVAKAAAVSINPF